MVALTDFDKYQVPACNEARLCKKCTYLRKCYTYKKYILMKDDHPMHPPSGNM